MDPVMLPVMTSTVSFTDRIAPAKQRQAETPQLPQADDCVEISGATPAPVEDKTTIINRSAYYDLESVKTDLKDCKSFIRMAEGKVYSTNNGLQDASRELRNSDFPLRRVQMDNDKTDVSREGYSIDQFISSAERELNNSKREDDGAARFVDELQKKLNSVQSKLSSIESSLNKPEEDKAAILVKKAIELTGSSQQQAGRSAREIEAAGREITSGSGQLTFADSYIWNIKSDRIGKDVSHDGRQLSFLVDRSQWDIRDAEREVRDAQYELAVTNQSIDMINRAVADAQNELVKKENH